jgi:hypothetical protein
LKKPAGTHARAQGGAEKRFHENRIWFHQGLVCRELLIMEKKIWLARGSPHVREICRNLPFQAGQGPKFVDVLKYSIATQGALDGHRND